ncbi:MAG: OmpH family outer membrane protein [Flammeovirgaceae bacterium]
MKNLPLILSIIALAASGFLLVNDFSGDKGADQVDVQTAGKIAFVNMDSLQTQYTYYIEAKADLNKREQNAKTDLQKRAQELLVKEESFRKQYNAGLLSANEAKLKQQKLQEAGANYQQYERSVQEGLLSYSQEKNVELNKKINEFLEEYNKSKGYSYIFSHGIGSPMLITDKAHDITQDVVVGLNAAYEKEKGEGDKDAE